MRRNLDENHWKEVDQCLDIVQLAPKLIESGLLSIGDPIDNTPVHRTRFISDVRRGGRGRFLSCFDPNEISAHMGHNYIACLLYGKRFADCRTVRLSSEYRRVFSRNMTRVVELLNVKWLLPHLLEKGLVTTEEASSLRIDSKTHTVTLTLFHILESKGPTAYSLLVKCIGDDKEHLGHKELYKLITEEQQLLTPTSLKQAKPAELTTGTLLSCQEYHDRRHEFEQHYHSGQWDKVYKLAQECMKSSTIEVQVIGHLELALSYIFRLNEGEILHHISEAEAIIKSLQNSNRTFLSGRCKYLLALLYHYLDEPLKAKPYIMDAKDILFAVEVGEDKSFAMYCDAIISATATLTDKSSQYEFDEVTRKFEIALSYSQCAYDMDILVIYCFLCLGRLYLGITETKIQKCSSQERFQQSKDCQAKLKNHYYSKMDERCKGLYYLNECDLHMSAGDTVNFSC